MGLDQYLHAKKYIGDWEHYGEKQSDERRAFKVIMDASGVGSFRCEESPSLEVQITCAYWRKANQIHKWFVDTIEDGKDDCQDTFVERDQLKLLVDTCKTVLAGSKLVAGKVVNGRIGTKEGWVDNIEDGEVIDNPAVAQKLLPTQEGFFFGSRDYNKWYLDDIKSTIKQIERALETFDEDWSFYYRASW